MVKQRRGGAAVGPGAPLKISINGRVFHKDLILSFGPFNSLDRQVHRSQLGLLPLGLRPQVGLRLILGRMEGCEEGTLVAFSAALNAAKRLIQSRGTPSFFLGCSHRLSGVPRRSMSWVSLSWASKALYGIWITRGSHRKFAVGVVRVGSFLICICKILVQNFLRFLICLDSISVERVCRRVPLVREAVRSLFGQG